MSNRLVCPRCGSGDMLSTIEEVESSARLETVELVDGRRVGTWSGLTVYGGSITVGIECECGWRVREDWQEEGREREMFALLEVEDE